MFIILRMFHQLPHFRHVHQLSSIFIIFHECSSYFINYHHCLSYHYRHFSSLPSFFMISHNLPSVFLRQFSSYFPSFPIIFHSVLSIFTIVHHFHLSPVANHVSSIFNAFILLRKLSSLLIISESFINFPSTFFIFVVCHHISSQLIISHHFHYFPPFSIHFIVFQHSSFYHEIELWIKAFFPLCFEMEIYGELAGPAPPL